MSDSTDPDDQRGIGFALLTFGILVLALLVFLASGRGDPTPFIVVMLVPLAMVVGGTRLLLSLGPRPAARGTGRHLRLAGAAIFVAGAIWAGREAADAFFAVPPTVPRPDQAAMAGVLVLSLLYGAWSCLHGDAEVEAQTPSNRRGLYLTLLLISLALVALPLGAALVFAPPG